MTNQQMTNHSQQAPAFAFDLNAEVRVAIQGRVIARTESTDRPNAYLVEYGDGKTREWIAESKLQEVGGE
jgi:hypothetical protein